MKNGSDIDSSLENWGDIKKDTEFSGILVGNGASRSVWEEFRYESLFKKASELPTKNALKEEDKRLFESFETTNFELVLFALATAKKVNHSLGLPHDKIDTRYDSIRNALVEAVHANHISWQNLSSKILSKIREEYLKYKNVYSTNYDLIIYWSIMADSGEGFKDYFWSDHFDVTNVEIWDKSTVVHFLHGGLHLVRTLTGSTEKRRATEGKSLLELFGTEDKESSTPLFISEGTAEQKQASILRSDYLGFVYSQFMKHEGPLCAIGHNLSDDADGHIVDAINHFRPPLLAIGIFPENEIKDKQEKARLIKQFPRINLRFFDSKTHPLISRDD